MEKRLSSFFKRKCSESAAQWAVLLWLVQWVGLINKISYGQRKDEQKPKRIAWPMGVTRQGEGLARVERGGLSVKRRAARILAVVVGILGVLGAYRTLTSAASTTDRPTSTAPLQTVSTIHAETQTWIPELNVVGTLRAVNGADLSLEVDGIVDEIAFNSGDEVKAGQVLLRLRSGDEKAKLSSLEALARLASLTMVRSRGLASIQAVSQANIETEQANLSNAEAMVIQQKAVLDKKSIRAPFDGRLGLRSVDRGQYLSAGTPVVTLQALAPIYVDFLLPQKNLDVVRVGQAVAASVDTFPTKVFDGTISAISPKVDIANRNVQIRATFENPNGMLMPGMFAKVKIAAGQPSIQVVLPQTAVVYSSYGDAVYVVKDSLTAHFRFITLGETRGDLVAVLSGVNENDLVVTAGQTKLHDGSKVRIDNTVVPTTDLDPTPKTR